MTTSVARCRSGPGGARLAGLSAPLGSLGGGLPGSRPTTPPPSCPTAPSPPASRLLRGSTPSAPRPPAVGERRRPPRPRRARRDRLPRGRRRRGRGRGRRPGRRCLAAHPLRRRRGGAGRPAVQPRPGRRARRRRRGPARAPRGRRDDVRHRPRRPVQRLRRGLLRHRRAAPARCVRRRPADPARRLPQPPAAAARHPHRRAGARRRPRGGLPAGRPGLDRGQRAEPGHRLDPRRRRRHRLRPAARGPLPRGTAPGAAPAAAMRVALRQSWEPIVASAATVVLGVLCLLLLRPRANGGSARSPPSASRWRWSPRSRSSPRCSYSWAARRSGRSARRTAASTRPAAAGSGSPASSAAAPAAARWAASACSSSSRRSADLRCRGDPALPGRPRRVAVRRGPGRAGPPLRRGTATPATVVTPADGGRPSPRPPPRWTAWRASSRSPAGAARARRGAGRVDGLVRLNATLADAPDSTRAQETVADPADHGARRRRRGAGRRPDRPGPRHPDTASRDLAVIVPLVLLVITLVLALLLRSLVAPLLLVATVVLSVGATVGVAALVFDTSSASPAATRGPAHRLRVPRRPGDRLQHLPDDPGPGGVAAARHARGRPAGLAVTGGVITSAGLVLAATFGALRCCRCCSWCSWLPGRLRRPARHFRRPLAARAGRGPLIGDGVWWPGRLAKGPAGEQFCRRHGRTRRNRRPQLLARVGHSAARIRANHAPASANAGSSAWSGTVRFSRSSARA